MARERVTDADGQGVSTNKPMADLRVLTDDTEELLNCAASQTGEQFAPARAKVEESLKTVAALKPKRAYFTHISHDLLHATVEARLPENVHMAYDGLRIPIGRADAL